MLNNVSGVRLLLLFFPQYSEKGKNKKGIKEAIVGRIQKTRLITRPCKFPQPGNYILLRKTSSIYHQFPHKHIL